MRRILAITAVLSLVAYAMYASAGKLSDLFRKEERAPSAVERSSGSVADFDRLKMAESRLASGDIPGARRLVSGSVGDILEAWRDVVTAEIHLADKEYDKAVAVLKKEPPRPRPELSFGEAFYRDLYRRRQAAGASALTALGRDATAERGELYVMDAGQGDASGPAPALTIAQKGDLLHRLHFGYRYKRIPGVVSVSEILAAPEREVDRCRASFELGNGLRYNAGMGGESLAALQALAGLDCPPEYAARGLYWLGYQAGVSGDLALAEESLTRLYRDYPDNRLADDALYQLRRFYARAGDAERARAYEEKLLSRKKGDMRHELVFEEGFGLFTKGEYDKAAAVFGRAADGEPTGDEGLPRTLYWRARALEKGWGKNDAHRAKVLYGDIVKRFPFAFYAVLAAHRIGQAVVIPPLPALKGSSPGGDFGLVDALNKKGRHGDASAVMDIILHDRPSAEKTHAEFVARKLMESRNYRKALDLAATHFDSGVYGPVGAVNDPMFAAFYPRAYARETAKGYAMTGLPKGAIEGIMREESLFQPNVRSSAGAVGLMQLMPGTAAMLRKKLPGELSELTDPQTSVILGATYLADMRGLFSDGLPFAVMAYNAGPGNVRKWLRNVNADELDEFIERIPIAETRGYVQRVLRTMQVYGGLYGDKFFRRPFFTLRIKGEATAAKR